MINVPIIGVSPSKGVFIYSYVDNMHIFCTSSYEINETKFILSSHIHMKDLVEACVILAIKITRDKTLL